MNTACGRTEMGSGRCKISGPRYHNNNGKYRNEETEGVKSLRSSRGLVSPNFPTNSSRSLPLIPVYTHIATLTSQYPCLPSQQLVIPPPPLETPVPLISNLCDATLFLLSQTLLI